MELCLQGEELIQHKKWSVYQKLHALCIAFSRIYHFAEKKDPYVIATLDAEEEILKVVFPDGNYHVTAVIGNRKKALYVLFIFYKKTADTEVYQKEECRTAYETAVKGRSRIFVNYKFQTNAWRKRVL